MLCMVSYFVCLCACVGGSRVHNIGVCSFRRLKTNSYENCYENCDRNTHQYFRSSRRFHFSFNLNVVKSIR